jgi:ATP adenylyltransferase
VKAQLVIPGITDPNTLVCLSRARKYKQYCKGVHNALYGICPFCKVDRDYNQVIVDTEYWLAWPSKPPEDNTRLHFLIVPKRHIISVTELMLAEWSELYYIIGNLKLDHGITSCGFLIRDGDATLSAGTIQHLHIHLMVPDGKRRVATPFFKGKSSERKSLARAIVFEKVRQGVVYSDLTESERELVQGRMA